MIFTQDDIITTDKYLNAFPNIYYKTDAIVQNRSIIWRNNKVHPPDKNSPIMLTGHSDYSITDKEVNLFKPKIWFTVNKQTTLQNVYSLPLGITNNTNESDLHSIYGNLPCMILIMNEQIAKCKTLVYMNFNINTFPEERQQVYNMFKDKKWVTIGHIKNTLEGRKQFLRDIKSHVFVLCPRGNGLDTHRLWETLYMGSIPIVKKDIAFKDFEDLPICFINDYNEISETFLQTEQDRIMNTSYCLDKLKIDYWINKIQQYNN